MKGFNYLSQLMSVSARANSGVAAFAASIAIAEIRLLEPLFLDHAVIDYQCSRNGCKILFQN